MEKAAEILRKIDDIVWGPLMLALLLGTGCYLMVRMRFLPLRNLGYALKCAVGWEQKPGEPRPGRKTIQKPGRKSGPISGRNISHRSVRQSGQKSDRNISNKSGRNTLHRSNQKRDQKVGRINGQTAGQGDISPFSSLMTELAATIGTGNIVGVATAMILGGPGALVWMIISSLVGLSTKFAESYLAVAYRSYNDKGEVSGGPMYTLRNGFHNKWLGNKLGMLFAFFAVMASFGMGNMTQSNSISLAMRETFGIPAANSGLAVTILTILVVLGGIRSISKVTQVVVPLMAVFYMLGTLTVIAVNIGNLPEGMGMILTMAFSPRAMAGGVGGSIVVSMRQALRWGVSRGVFSNEAGLGAAGISAAAANTSDPVRQGYISMTGVFLDTVVLCSVTGLALAASGVLGMTDAKGELLTGTALTIAAFATTFGEWGAYLVSIGIVLFAFATIIGWAYQGEKAFEFLVKKSDYCIVYRFVYGFVSFAGAVCALDVVWDFSDIMNGLMAIPNLICVLALSGKACDAIVRYERGRKEYRQE